MEWFTFTNKKIIFIENKQGIFFMIKINKKIIIMSVSMLCVMQAYAMEKQNAEEQNAIDLYNNGWLTGTDLFYQAARAGVNLVADGANSLWETATVATSDIKKLSKLGYPPTNEVNNAELAKFVTV